MLNHHTWFETITLLLLVHHFKWPTHCPEQLVETDKLRQTWDCVLFNDGKKMGKVLRCRGVEERNKLHPGEKKKSLC